MLPDLQQKLDELEGLHDSMRAYVKTTKSDDPEYMKVLLTFESQGALNEVQRYRSWWVAMLRKILMASLFISLTGCICSEKDGRPGLFLTSSGQLGGNAPKN